MKKKEDHDRKLSVRDGVNQPSILNGDAVERFRKQKRKKLTVDQFYEGITSGDRIILSQAITMVESALPKHKEMAQKIIERCLPHSGNSIRIGITGVPGVGKSSFIESFGMHLIRQGHSTAVLAVDPSSERSKGSILGDKTRMEQLSTEKKAFIRPSPSAGSIGGVARKTRESIILCEAAGFDTIIIETVGVGQSETTVHSMVDFFLLLMLAGAGDELQGIKRGIMEMADIIAITKADGDNEKKAQQARAGFSNALHLFPPAESGWTPCVLTCSALTNKGIDKIWNTIQEYRKFTTGNGYFSRHRSEQAKYRMYETISQALHDHFYNNTDIQEHLKKLEHELTDDKVSSYIAAKRLLKRYFKNIK